MIQKGGVTTLGAALTAGLMTTGLIAVGAPAQATAAPSDIAQAGGQRFAPGEVVVGYEPGTSRRERAAVRDEAGAELQRRLLVARTELISLDPDDSVKAAVADLEGQPEVAYAEPNFIYSLAAMPDDPRFIDGTLWGLSNDGTVFGADDADIDAPEAWDTTTGSSDVVVGVVDSGIATSHPDLNDNIWVNDAEASGVPASDDEPNGFVDDTNGWDFVSDDNDPSDGEGHGTHVAGTIGAEGNNAEGVVGVNWDVSLMALRACDSVGACLSSDVADAFAYAGANGARVVNASLSGSGQSLAQSAAIAAAPNTLFVVAAGNEANNNDVSPRYPCNYPEANLICVGASTDEDTPASFTNYGSGSVDLAAPGGGAGSAPVYSTYPFADRASENFSAAFPGPLWDRGGYPPAWYRTTEASDLPGATLTDSPGADYANGTDSYARYGPVDLSADSSCHLRYDLALAIPDPDDHLVVEASTDDVTYTPIQDWTGTGSSTLTPDVSVFAGFPTVYLRFRLVSDGAVTGDGVHLDNVRLRCSAPVYAYLQGTSMATPHVAGTAALLLAQNGSATVAQLRDWLLDGVDLKSSMDEKFASGGRLNAARALAGAMGQDIHRPQTTIVAGPPASSQATSAGFSFTSDEPGSFRCSLNGAAYSGCSSPTTLSKLAVGTHNFRVRAVDANGNEDATPASYSFTVEPLELSPCQRARTRLRQARTTKQKRKARKQVKKRCARTA